MFLRAIPAEPAALAKLRLKGTTCMHDLGFSLEMGLVFNSRWLKCFDYVLEI
jgi:hypothetical protein